MSPILHKTLIFSLLATMGLRSMAQFDFPIMGGGGFALGGISTTLTDAPSSIHNVAGLGFLSQSFVGIGVEQNFMAKGVGYKSVQGALCIPHGGSVALDYCHFGSSTYNEQIGTLCYGLAVHEKIAIGVGLHYLHSSTSDNHYNSQNLMTFSLGAQFRPSERLQIGVNAFNPTAIKLSTTETQRMASRFRAGVSYRLCDPLTGHLEVEQRMLARTILRFGLEYSYRQSMFVRMGYCTYPNSLAFGIGYRSSHYAIDLGSQIHPQLGMTPQISVNHLF